MDVQVQSCNSILLSGLFGCRVAAELPSKTQTGDQGTRVATEEQHYRDPTRATKSPDPTGK
ncbi:hypothetical protein LguiA_021917 [Lonicera macranthoides]